MNCAWCSPSNNGTDGICDTCMQRYFGVDPATIHAEIAIEEAKEQTAAKWDNSELPPMWEQSLVVGTKATYPLLTTNLSTQYACNTAV
jgi:hypothetical protein